MIFFNNPYRQFIRTIDVSFVVNILWHTIVGDSIHFICETFVNIQTLNPTCAVDKITRGVRIFCPFTYVKTCRVSRTKSHDVSGSSVPLHMSRPAEFQKQNYTIFP